MNKTKLYKFLNSLLAIIVAVLAIYYIVRRFKESPVALLETLPAQLGLYHFALLAVVILLMGFNWLFETLKWRQLIVSLFPLSFPKALISILTGLSFGLITPNRIGEWGGRLMFVPEGRRTEALYMNLMASFAQLLITVCAGTIAFAYLNAKYDYLAIAPILIVPIVLGSCLVLLLLYFRMGKFRKYLQWISSDFMLSRIAVLPRLSNKQKLINLFWSAARYLIFVAQMYLMLLILELPMLDSLTVIAAIATVFLLATIIPSGWISELPLRASVAYLVFETIGENPWIALTASLLLWAINLALPALMGVFFIRKAKWFPQQALKDD